MTERTCPKCRSAMHGPAWSASSNLLHWRCRCGYSDTTQPADAAPDINDLLRQFAGMKIAQRDRTS